MSKVFLYIGGGIFVIITLIFVADYFLNIPITRSIPGINQLTCKSAISVSGSSMEPAIKVASRVTFNKCKDISINFTSFGEFNLEVFI